MSSQREHIPPADRWQLVNYLPSIQLLLAEPLSPAAAEPPQPVISESKPPPPKGQEHGGVRDGKQVFEMRCGICHSTETRNLGVGSGLQELLQWPPHILVGRHRGPRAYRPADSATDQTGRGGRMPSSRSAAFRSGPRLSEDLLSTSGCAPLFPNQAQPMELLDNKKAARNNRAHRRRVSE